jgi:DNA-binding SARP family transcriptional activator
VSLDSSRLALDTERFLALEERAGRLLGSGDREAAVPILREAEAAYGGDLLEEDPDADWAAALREEARAAYLRVARALAEEATRTGDADGALRRYLRILDQDPFDEDAHLGLVRALLLAGRHGEARRRYGIYAARMSELQLEAASFPTPAAAADR